MAQFEYDAYRFGSEPPLVRIARRGTAKPSYQIPAATVTGYPIGLTRDAVTVLEVRLDWTNHEPFEVSLGDDLWVSVAPHAPGAPPRFGLIVWGRCTAYVRRWGATAPLEMLDPRVIAGLRRREEFEAFGWMVLGGDAV